MSILESAAIHREWEARHATTLSTFANEKRRLQDGIKDDRTVCLTLARKLRSSESSSRHTVAITAVDLNVVFREILSHSTELLPGDKITAKLPSRNAELLLAECGALSDRVLQQYTLLRSLVVDQRRIQLELDEFFALDEVYQKELTEGVTAIASTLAEATALSTKATYLRAQEWHTWITTNEAQKRELAQLVAGNAAIPFYATDSARLHRVPKEQWKAPHKAIPADPLPGDHLAMDLAELQFFHEHNIAQRQIEMIAIPAHGRMALEEQVWLLQKRAEVLKTERYAVTYKFMRQRLTDLTAESGAFNYDSRIENLQNLITIDLLELYGKALVAARAVGTVYGSTLAEAELNSAVASNRPANELLKWIRVWTAALSRVVDTDQLSSHVFSLSKHATGGFDPVGASSWRLQVKDRAFTDHHLVRMRGISIHSKSNDETAIYCVKIETAADMGTERATFGRVSHIGVSAHSRNADALHFWNLNPVREWQIEIDWELSTATRKQDLRDLFIEFHVSSQRAS